jgi:hypothetical protein
MMEVLVSKKIVIALIALVLTLPSILFSQVYYFPGTDHYYERIEIPANYTWHQCRDSAITLGGYLATSTSADENEFLLNLTNPYYSFLGGSDSETEGVWEWISGEPWSYTTWDANQPDAAFPDEDYLVLYPAVTSTGSWSDERNLFLTEEAFIVEWDYNPNVIEFGGHWYEKIIIEGDGDWHKCRDSAIALGGDLAAINSQAENDFLAAFCDPLYTFLGGTDEGSEGSWYGINGYPWSFTAWAAYEPSNGSGVEHYLHFWNPINTWNDVKSPTPQVKAFLVEYLDYTDVDDTENSIKFPEDYTLLENYPNPFNPGTNIIYSLPTRSQVTISIFNILGQKINVIVDDEKSAGKHTVQWNGTDFSGREVPSGVYLYQLRTGDFTQSKKMLLLK